MFKLVSRGVRLATCLRSSTFAASCSCESLIRRPFTRTYWLMTANMPGDNQHSYGKMLPQKCACGCASSAMHTKGDKELTEFLEEEIKAELKSQKQAKLPAFEGFDVVSRGSALEFVRQHNNQNVKVTVNVNHTVDAEIPDDDINPSQDKMEMSEMKSKPGFLVEIQRGTKTLAFGCSIMQDVNPETQNDPEAYSDIFNIDEVALFEGSRQDSTYAVSGEIMDGYLYDLLMNYLDERGISNEFAEKLVEYCTSYEHKLYVGLLQDLKSFASK